MAWKVLLACAPVFGVGYMLLPVEGSARTIAYPAFGLIAVAAILVAIWRGAPTRPRSWALIAVGLGLLSGGDVSYTILALNLPEMPYPSLADAFYLGGYGALAFGVTGLARGRMAGGDRTPIIDGAILAAGAASIFWIAIGRPSIEGTFDPIVATVSLAYPCLDLVLLGLGLRVLLSTSDRPGYLHLLLAALALYFAADVIYAMALLEGSYVDGHYVDVGWVVGITLFGAAGLHPSIADPVSNVEPNRTLSRSRLALLALAAMMAPGILLVQAVGSGDGDAIGVIVTWTLLFGLVLVRLATTVDELGLSLLQRRRLQEDLVYQANHDPLTRLANRALFEERLAASIAARPATTGLVFLDLDDFKAINDTLGHASGDELLRVLAERIRRELRSVDLGARLGGDEFAVLIEDCPDEMTARAVAERVLGTLRTPVSLGGRQLQVHASAGVAVGRADSTAMDLMRDADVAMYEAKSHGKDQAETYQPTMHSQIVQSYQLRTELSEAITGGQFVLHYQPAVRIETGEIVGAEALVRWLHPERGMVPPAEFIQHAESSGLIHDLGRWILHEACRTAASWPDLPNGDRPAISVNIAAGQLLQPSFVDEVKGILADTGLAPALLFLEVTESALVDLEPARKALERLRDAGVGLALDDFGTGYSALSYLAALPFHVVKIDRSFIASAAGGERDEALLRGIVGLCDALQLIVVAEGIEDEGQLERVRKLGCLVGQGYLFARPQPNAAFAALLTSGLTDRSSARTLELGGLRGLGTRRGTSAAG